MKCQEHQQKVGKIIEKSQKRMQKLINFHKNYIAKARYQKYKYFLTKTVYHFEHILPEIFQFYSIIVCTVTQFCTFDSTKKTELDSPK